MQCPQNDVDFNIQLEEKICEPTGITWFYAYTIVFNKIVQTYLGVV